VDQREREPDTANEGTDEARREGAPDTSVVTGKVAGSTQPAGTPDSAGTIRQGGVEPSGDEGSGDRGEPEGARKAEDQAASQFGGEGAGEAEGQAASQFGGMGAGDARQPEG
jgi:hypothetical protein